MLLEFIKNRKPYDKKYILVRSQETARELSEIFSMIQKC